MESVMIKGVRSGIILVLDAKQPYELLQGEIAHKFDEASAFLGKARMGLMVRGKELTQEQEADVLKIIAEHTDLDIVCVIQENGSLDETFEKYINQKKHSDIAKTVPVPERVQDKRKAAVMENPSTGNAFIYKGNVRSGQSLRSEHSLIILGDVNPGGSIISDGSIFVIGSLMGNAFAGATGNQNAFIMSNDFHPLQVRIADAIAVSPNEEGGRSGKFLGRHNRNMIKGPEVAFISTCQIIRSIFTEQFIKDSQFC